MALQTMKETNIAAALCRLSPPNSPSKRATKSARGCSKILAAFDAAMLGRHNPSPLHGDLKDDIVKQMSNDIHPFFLTTGASHSGKLLHSKTQLMTSKPRSSRSSSTSESSNARRSQAGSSALSGTMSAEASATPSLPLYSYKDYDPVPAVVYIRHEDEANELVQNLSGPLGFDMEWVVSWRKRAYSEHRTAVIQLCDKRMILVIQVSQMKRFPEKVKEVIESSDVIKMGANIKNDGEKLYRDYGILASNLVELGTFARRADTTFARAYTRQIVALAKVVAHYTGKMLDKGKVRMGDWEAAPLSEQQVTYAANDAHCALIVYNRLLAIEAKQGHSLDAASVGSNIVPHTRTTNIGVRTTISRTSSGSSAYRPVSYVNNVDELQVKPRPSPQYLRAYKLWHKEHKPLLQMCATLSTKGSPLKESTVISYVVRALQDDPSLPFSMDRLKELVQSEAGSWARHRDWITKAESSKS
ncbi:ribonuclease H-like protein [Daedalea quercina L-15889]|uniref:Ribonuclease H-like protein n=1 Tax=Daedalea quercina L-15889 TaxID=1314783 RepID=A0A165KP03_9APHY|nr:ribonuclease H-like protein [Daedalea quercina L-15889]